MIQIKSKTSSITILPLLFQAAPIFLSQWRPIAVRITKMKKAPVTRPYAICPPKKMNKGISSFSNVTSYSLHARCSSAFLLIDQNKWMMVSNPENPTKRGINAKFISTYHARFRLPLIGILLRKRDWSFPLGEKVVDCNNRKTKDYRANRK